MTPAGGTGASRLRRRLRRLTVGAAGPGPAWALALIALLAALVAAGGPREETALQTRALQQALAATPPTGRAVTASTGWPITGRLTAAQLQVITDVIGASLRPPLDSPPRQRWSGLTTTAERVGNPAPSALLSGGAPVLEVSYRSGLARHARLVSGSYPDAASQGRLPDGRTVVTLAVAATQATAARFGLRPGSELDLAAPGGGGTAVVLRVAGLLRPADLPSAFWADDPVLAAPVLGAPERKGAPNGWYGGVFVGPAELGALEDAYVPTTAQLSWAFPLRTGGLKGPQEAAVAGLLTSLETGGTGSAAMVAAGAQLENPPAISAGLVSLLDGLSAEQHAVSAIDSLLTVGLLAVALILLLVCALIVADAYREELALIRARGGSVRQVAARVLLRTLAVAGPALAAGTVLAVLAVPDGGNRASWLLAGATCVIAVVGPALIAAWEHRGPRPQAAARGDLVIPRRSPRRRVAEITALAVVAGGVAALRRRGVAGGDLFVSSVPVLVAVAAGLIVARAYPLPLRLLQRLAAAGRGAVGYLGIARAARARSVPLLPALALVVALAVVAVGGMIRDAVSRGQVTASWQQVGADALIEAPGSVPPAAQRAIAAVPGVSRVATVYLASAGSAFAGNLLSGGFQSQLVGVLIVNPARYAALSAQTPWGAFPAGALARPGPGGAVPVIASPQIAAAFRAGASQLAFGSGQLTVRLAATVASTPALPGGGSFVVVPAWAAARLPANLAPNVLLATGLAIDGPALAATAARTVPGSQVVSRAAVLQSVAGSPPVRGSALIWELCVAAAAVFCAAAVLLGLLRSGRDRAQQAARLAALGMTVRQRRNLVLLEALPLLLAAIIGAELAGWLLAPLVGPALDLSAFTSSSAPVPVRPDLVALLAPAAGIIVLVAVITAGESALARRHPPGSALRLDEGR
jgi:putative ABC transport system permease protein